MKNITVIFTSGRGPKEASMAVYGIQKKFIETLETFNIKYNIVSVKKGPIDDSLETIAFKIDSTDNSILNNWLGTIQWICKSPIRKHTKRKNWFVKCCSLVVSNSPAYNLDDIEVQTYRASGPGGQHRNKVETAVRLTHRPSGTTVTASESRSQKTNLTIAKDKLKKEMVLASQKTASENNMIQWASKITIERGNAIKVFEGLNFKER